MIQPKKPVVKVVKKTTSVKVAPTAREKKNLEDASKNENMRPPFTPEERKKMKNYSNMGSAKSGTTMKKAKSGANMKKAEGGINVVPRNLNKRQLERVQRINETSRDRANKVGNRISDRRNARGAENPRMNGDAQFNMKSGGKMKKCKGGC